MHDVWKVTICMILLIMMSIEDIRNQSISLKLIILGGLMAVIYRICSFVLASNVNGLEYALDCIWACVPGLLLICISLVSSQKMGLGDGVVAVEIGLGMGLDICILTLTIALFINCIWAGILLMFHRANRKSTIPFVPFLSLGVGIASMVIR